MRTIEKFGTIFGGDILEVEWDGNVWVAGGRQYANRNDAMRQELADYLLASGDEVDDVDRLDLANYGEWAE